ncbi:hypothetical protein GLOIN_2v1763838 [Rhizophagus clarus]|uniref:TLDc domain-containing protein n=1 Tax=Rhizophagus clarus TaxID=94130 RepID=A0A8H3L8D6_9GLOM|nr:hypothetical protein GLOIN_2v1763838 [Rhizophagus clarus]
MLRVLKSLNKFKKVENDVIIYVGEGPDIKEFRSYSKTLCNKSEYFKKILSDENIEKENGSCIIKIPNINTEIFEIIIKNINGTEDLNKKTGIEILNIIIASDDLKLSYLVKQAEDFFMKHRQLLRNEPVEILQLTFHHKTFKDILDRNDLNLIEIKIWDNLIKWISAQEKTLTKNQFNRFISLIRFYDISSEDYFHKVKPYKEFLSKDMQEEILKFHMIPEYKPILVNFLPRRNYSVTSILINQDHFALFANWIDRKHRYCNFILLYRASRDGKTAAAFHNRCDNRGATIVVVKIKNSEQIAGGYNPLSWDSSGSNKSTKESFLFNFMDKNDFQSANVVNSKGDQYSLV